MRCIMKWNRIIPDGVWDPVIQEWRLSGVLGLAYIQSEGYHWLGRQFQTIHKGAKVHHDRVPT